MPATSFAIQPPRLHHSILEMSRIFFEAGSSVLLRPLRRHLPRGDGHTVMTLPGFLGADGSTAALRRFLDRQGYQAIPWGLGRNVSEQKFGSMEQVLQYRREVESSLAQKLEEECQRSGAKVSLIGWSLGGLYATTLAHRHPQWLRQVITLGTPFGDPRGTSLYGVMNRLYKADIDEQAIGRWIEHSYDGDLQVPITALYSESDGIVSPDIARCRGSVSLVENIAVMASHVGFPFNPLVRAVIAERLAQPEGQWRPYDKLQLKPFVHVA